MIPTAALRIPPTVAVLLMSALGCERDSSNSKSAEDPAGVAEHQEISAEPFAAQLAKVKAGSSDAIASDDPSIDDSDLFALGDLPQLRRLELPQARIRDLGAQAFRGTANLESLVLGETTISAEGWDFIVQLSRLRRLNLAGAQIDDSALKGLANLKSLELLRLGSPLLTDAGLAHLSGMSNLRHLILRNAPITDAGLVHLAKLPTLESLYLEGTNVTTKGEHYLLEKRPDLHLHFP